MSIRKHKKIYLTVLVLILIIAGVIIFRSGQSKPLEVQEIKKGNITESLTATGAIASKTSVNLNFLSSGRLIFLEAKKGDFIKANQIIAMLDERTLEKNLESSLRDYALQRSTFDQTQDNNANRRPDQALNDAMKRVLQNNQYNLDKAVFSVELQQLAKENSVLISPISGIVTRADVQTTGVFISSSTTFTIADPENLIFKIDIGEADIGKVRIGKPVNINLDAFPDKTFHQLVQSIDFTTHTASTGEDVYTIEVTFPRNDELNYRVGMNGDAEIILSRKKNVLIVPVVSIQDDKYVYVQKHSGFEKRTIVTGSKNDTSAEVISGLKAGEKVALSPMDAEKLTK